MFRTNKYVPIIAMSALAAPEFAQAIRAKTDSQWHLAMVPDDFGFDNGPSFMAQPRSPMGFGFSDPFFSGSNFGGLGGFGGNHFDDFAMPSFGSHMGDMMREAEQNMNGAHGNSWSSSSSQSYSSSIGADGKKHEKKSKMG